MRAYARGAVAFAALSLSALGATAADSISLSTSTRTSSLPVYEEPRVDWTGFYAGVYGVGQFSSANASQFGLGALAGVSAQFDLVLVGAEVAIHGLDGGAGAPTVYGQMLGLAGLVVNDDVAVYAAAGFGLDLGATTQQGFPARRWGRSGGRRRRVVARAVPPQLSGSGWKHQGSVHPWGDIPLLGAHGVSPGITTAPSDDGAVFLLLIRRLALPTALCGMAFPSPLDGICFKLGQKRAFLATGAFQNSLLLILTGQISP